MTDSSSKEAIGEIAAELMHTKIESARKDTQMTHVLRIGSFHMEIVPHKDIDIEKLFEKTLKSLMDRYDEKILLSAGPLDTAKMYG